MANVPDLQRRAVDACAGLAIAAKRNEHRGEVGV
jgi:hypothetical protein